MCQAERDFSSGLINYLYQECFKPKESLPIYGQVSLWFFHAREEGEVFGPMQKLMIRFMPSSLGQSQSFPTAPLIIRMYYDSNKPEVWDSLGTRILNHLSLLTLAAIDSNLIITNCQDISLSTISLFHHVLFHFLVLSSFCPVSCLPPPSIPVNPCPVILSTCPVLFLVPMPVTVV
jgi:hypothetical protein